MKIVFLIIAYNNEPEVVSFAGQIEHLASKSEHDIAVCVADNIGNFDAEKLNHLAVSCDVVKPKRNLGYLGGCGYALQRYLANNALPDWILVSNTDLELPNDFLDIIEKVPAHTGQLSPAVQKRNGHSQNPHILNRPGTLYYLKQRAIHLNSFIGALYIWLSGRARPKATPALDKNQHGDMEIYCAHGSVFFLSKEFFLRGGEIKNGPFLYGEEIYIGEQLYDFGLTSLCRRQFLVLHDAHSTSKWVSLRSKSRLFRASFKLLHSKYKSVGFRKTNLNRAL